MLTIYWLMGPTCVGKSTWAIRQGVPLVGTGLLARGILGSRDAMAEAPGGPLTPAAAEEDIRLHVSAAISNAGDNGILIVDSMPRSLAQIDWILEGFYPRKTKNVFLYSICEEKERKRRIEERCGGPDEAALIKVRTEIEDSVFPKLIEYLVRLRVSLRVLDLSSPSMESVSIYHLNESTDLELMFEVHRELSDKALEPLKVRMSDFRSMNTSHPYHPSARWTKRFLRALAGEVQEALDEISDEWWTVDQVDFDKVRMELIDQWHFLMSAAMATGMSAEDFAALYYKKRSINLARWESGKYSKKKT